MRLPPIVVLAMLLGCATAPTHVAELPLEAKVTVVETTPAPSSRIEADTHVEIVADYMLPEVQAGKDGIAIVLKTTSGGTRMPDLKMIFETKGRVTFAFLGADLMKDPSLPRPIEMRVVIRRAGTEVRTSPAVAFQAERMAARNPGSSVKFVPPTVGRGQVLIDPIHDPRYTPRLPPELDQEGKEFWALYKVCVDPAGTVYDVTMLKSAHALVDARWAALLQTWPHKPYVVNGTPVFFCYPLRLAVRSSK